MAKHSLIYDSPKLQVWWNDDSLDGFVVTLHTDLDKTVDWASQIVGETLNYDSWTVLHDFDFYHEGLLEGCKLSEKEAMALYIESIASMS